MANAHLKNEKNLLQFTKKLKKMQSKLDCREKGFKKEAKKGKQPTLLSLLFVFFTNLLP